MTEKSIIHAPVFELIRESFSYLFDEYGFKPIRWVENASSYGFYKIRLSSPTHIVEFLYDDPFIASWLGLVSSTHLFVDSFLGQFLDPVEFSSTSLAGAEQLVDLLPLDGIVLQLEQISRLLWQPYLTQFMGTELYQDEAVLISAANPPWMMVRMNEWKPY